MWVFLPSPSKRWMNIKKPPPHMGIPPTQRGLPTGEWDIWCGLTKSRDVHFGYSRLHHAMGHIIQLISYFGAYIGCTRSRPRCTIGYGNDSFFLGP